MLGVSELFIHLTQSLLKPREGRQAGRQAGRHSLWSGRSVYFIKQVTETVGVGAAKDSGTMLGVEGDKKNIMRDPKTRGSNPVPVRSTRKMCESFPPESNMVC